MDNNSYFTNIRSEILSRLYEAKKEVLIAMAWFTNKELFNACLDCLKRGVKIELILLDDLINHCDFGIDFNQFIDNGGSKFFLYPQNQKFLHHKFCIIDGKILITGSYNWTNYAETRNLENIIITKDSNLIKDYIQCFNDMKNELNQIKEFAIIKTMQIPENVFVSRIRDLSQEISSLPDSIYQSFNKPFIERLEQTNTKIPEESNCLMPTKHIFHKPPTERFDKIEVVKVENFKYPISKFNIGFKAHLLDQGGKEGLKIMIKKGQVLPYTVTRDAQSYDSGGSAIMSSSCEFFYGNSDDISKCTKFGETLTLKNLPKKSAGEVKFKIILSLDELGNLSIKFVCTNSGIGVESKQYNADFIEYMRS